MPVSVHVRAVEPTRPDLEAGVARVYAHLRKVDAVLSTWRADSDLLRLQHGEREEAHPWVADVTELCLEAEERTDGLFRAWRRRPRRAARVRPHGTGEGLGRRGRGGPPRRRAGDRVQHRCGRRHRRRCRSGTVGGGADLADRHRGPAASRRGGAGGPGAARGGRDVRRRGSWCPRRRPPHRGGDHRAGRSATVVGPDLLWADVWATAAWVDPGRRGALMAERDPAYGLLTI